MFYFYFFCDKARIDIIKLKLKYLYDNISGEKKGVIISVDAYNKLIETIEDYEDYQALKNRPKKEAGKLYTFEEIMAERDKGS